MGSAANQINCGFGTMLELSSNDEDIFAVNKLDNNLFEVSRGQVYDSRDHSSMKITKEELIQLGTDLIKLAVSDD